MTVEGLSTAPILAVVNLVHEDDDGSATDVLQQIFSKAFKLTAHADDSNQRVLSISCKYYTAELVVKATQDRKEVEKAEAVVIYFDGQESTSSWRRAFEWMQLSKSWEIPLRLLVCHRLSSSQQFHRTVTLAMLGVQFELVELDPSEDTVEPGEEYGLARIKSAIEAHMWPNMKMLEHAHARRRAESKPVAQTIGKATASTVPTAGPSEPKPARGKSPSTKTEKPVPDEGDTDFVKLFASLMDFRRQVMNCKDKERRHRLAEQFTVRFWRSIDGLEDETEGLRSCSEEDEDKADEAETVSCSTANPPSS